jgi:hypothetical protein
MLFSPGSLTSAGTYASVVLPHNQVCRTETIEITLIADHRGYGLILEHGGCDSEVLVDPPIVTFIEPRSAAERYQFSSGICILAFNVIIIRCHIIMQADHCCIQDIHYMIPMYIFSNV